MLVLLKESVPDFFFLFNNRVPVSGGCSVIHFSNISVVDLEQVCLLPALSGVLIMSHTVITWSFQFLCTRLKQTSLQQVRMYSILFPILPFPLMVTLGTALLTQSGGLQTVARGLAVALCLALSGPRDTIPPTNMSHYFSY